MMKYLTAQDAINNPALGKTLQGKTGEGFFQTVLPNMVGLSLVIGVLIFIFITIVGAIQWMISGGDKAAIESAKGKITNAIIGVVVLFSLFAVFIFIENFFDINILSLDLEPLKIK